MCASIDKATQMLGHVPVYAGEEGLRRGLGETIAWLTRPENLAGYKPHLYAH